MRRSQLLLSAALAASLPLSACGTGAATDDGSIQHPGGDEVVLSVEHAGGLVPVEFLFTSMPAFTLLGDGRVIVQGGQIEIFPGPALPAVQVRRLTEEGIQAVLRQVAQSRQFAADAEWRGAANFVADAGDTIFTLRAEGREVSVTVHALGAFLPEDAPQGISEAELAAHQALSELVNWLTTLESELPATAWADLTWRDYEPDALRLLVRNADADEADPAIPFAEVPWPADGDAAGFGAATNLEGYRCGAVDGADAEAWYTALASANQVTRFTADGHRYHVMPRPLLPHEEIGCPHGLQGA